MGRYVLFEGGDIAYVIERDLENRVPFLFQTQLKGEAR
jgi:hypothetical protein